MTSKNLFFNIMKEDLKRRLWTVALISLFFFFVFPVNAAMLLSDYAEDIELALSGTRGSTVDMINARILRTFSSWVSVENGLLIAFVCIFSVVCAVSGFSYLHSKKKTDFFHSIPLKREKLFAANYINGILYTAVPYFVCLVLAVSYVKLKTGIDLPWGDVFVAYLSQMVFYTLLYTTAVLAVVMTGNTIVSLIGILVFSAWGPSVTGVIMAYYQEFFKTFYLNDEVVTHILTKSSPVAWYSYAISEGTPAASVYGALVAAAVICGLAVVLYRIRPSEAAGRAMAFKKSEPVIKFLIVVPTSLFGSLVFRQMRSDGDGWSIFGLICGLIITYCIIEIIYNFDFRRLFSHKRQLALCGVVTLAIFAYFRFDFSGYDTYIPSKDKVETSAIYSIDLDGGGLYSYRGTPVMNEHQPGNHYLSIDDGSEIELLREMQLLNTEDVLAIAESGINSNRENKDSRTGITLMPEDQMRYSSVAIKYHLKNGKDVFRSYIMPSNEVEKRLESIYDTQEYKRAMYPILKAEDLSNYAGVNYEECGEYRHVNFSDAGIQEKVIKAYQEELSGLTYAVRRTESPIASIQFKTKEFQEMFDTVRREGNSYSVYNVNEWGYYPVYPSFTKTISLLKECGISTGTYLSSENVEKIEIIKETDYKYNVRDTYSYAQAESIAVPVDDVQGSNLMIVRDKNQIDEILNGSIFYSYRDINQLNETEDRLSVTAYVKMSADKKSSQESDFFDKDESADLREYQTFRIAIDKDKVPEFVKKQLLEKEVK